MLCDTCAVCCAIACLITAWRDVRVFKVEHNSVAHKQQVMISEHVKLFNCLGGLGAATGLPKE